MLPINNDDAFRQLIEKLQGINRIPYHFQQTVQQFPDYHVDRPQGPVPDAMFTPHSPQALVDEGIVDGNGGRHPMPRYRMLETGLREFGWSMWPHSPKNLGEGAYGRVQLIFKTEDLNLPFPQKRMAALKMQPLTDLSAEQLWKEMSVMSCVRHVNIVDFFGAFVVTPKSGDLYTAEKKRGLHDGSPKKVPQPAKKAFGPATVPDPDEAVYVKRWKDKSKPRPVTPEPDASKEPEPKPRQATDVPDPEQREKEDHFLVDTFCFLMEYANAGSLYDEILRYPNLHLSEPGARYYMKQIIAGISHMHSRHLVHYDLHNGNVVLKYNPDGITKRCLLCGLWYDFNP